MSLLSCLLCVDLFLKVIRKMKRKWGSVVVCGTNVILHVYMVCVCSLFLSMFMCDLFQVL